MHQTKQNIFQTILIFIHILQNLHLTKLFSNSKFTTATGTTNLQSTEDPVSHIVGLPLLTSKSKHLKHQLIVKRKRAHFKSRFLSTYFFSQISPPLEKKKRIKIKQRIEKKQHCRIDLSSPSISTTTRCPPHTSS